MDLDHISVHILVEPTENSLEEYMSDLERIGEANRHIYELSTMLRKDGALVRSHDDIEDLIRWARGTASPRRKQVFVGLEHDCRAVGLPADRRVLVSPESDSVRSTFDKVVAACEKSAEPFSLLDYHRYRSS